jgi:hypothetical protein
MVAASIGKFVQIFSISFLSTLISFVSIYIYLCIAKLLTVEMAGWFSGTALDF